MTEKRFVHTCGTIRTAAPLALVLSIVLALFGSICWTRVLTVGSEVPVSNTFAGLALFVATLVLMLKGLPLVRAASKRCLLMSGLFSAAFALAVTLGWRIQSSGVHDDLFAYGNAGLTSPTTYIIALGLFVVAFVAVSALFVRLNQMRRKPGEGSGDPVPSSRLTKWLDDHGLAVAMVSFLVIFLCWIPVLLSFFPGINGYDFVFQAKRYFDGTIDTHHPVIHTLLLGLMLQLGYSVGAVWVGILLYCLFQMIVMAAIFAYAVRCVWWLSRSRLVTLLALLWFALCPLSSVLAVSTTKDTLFGGFVTLSICVLLSCARRGLNKERAIGLVLSVSLALLFRNNAVVAYAALLLCLAMAMALRRRLPAIQMLLVALAPVIVYAVVTGPVYSTAGIASSDTAAESLSVPLQQLARVANTSDDLSQDDLELIGSLIPNWTGYQAGISDVIKNSLDQEYLFDNLELVAERYLAIGLEHPLTYIESFLVNTYAYWYPDVPAFSRGGFTYHPYLEVPSNMENHNPEAYIVIQHSSIIPVLGPTYENMILQHGWESIPILSLFMSSGAIIWPYLFLSFWWASKRRDANILMLPAVFLVLYWGTCLLGPCALVRYIYPLYTALPLIAACTVFAFHSRRPVDVGALA